MGDNAAISHIAIFAGRRCYVPCFGVCIVSVAFKYRLPAKSFIVKVIKKDWKMFTSLNQINLNDGNYSIIYIYIYI